MIRRHVADEFWLIAQHDHALLSGHLAEQIGGGEFERPAPRAIRGIALHDCGWPLHDDEAPTLNERGQPLDVFESTPEVAMLVWPASARRAAHDDPYAGLLVSLHVLSLSVIATTPAASVPNSRFDTGDARARFQVNQFQQQQIELQESLREQLGMRIDEPRRYGLAEQSTDPRERQLIYDFRLLQAMDKLSLSICCSKTPFDAIEPLPAHPDGPDRPLRATRAGETDLVVSPWIFEQTELRVAVPFRRLKVRAFSTALDFREVYANAAREHFECVLRRP
jgi:hypothetical protein